MPIKNTKWLVTGSAMILLSGCASTIQQGSGDVSAELEGEVYVLNLEMDKHIRSGFFSSDIRNDVSLYVNGIRSIRGPLHSDGSGHLKGSYDGKPVTLDCVKPHVFTNSKCDVHIAGRKVETLTFTPGSR